ncbi:MAG: hypothetical protein ACRCUE_17910, partial [Bosea sp. (in: a-proteobacteria)]
PDQPRVPAGQTGGGQWGSGDGGGDTIDDGRFDVAGGFDSEQREMTASAFASAFCRGQVRREIPGQFENMLIGDVMKLARGGDAAARKCLKILGRERFQK